MKARKALWGKRVSSEHSIRVTSGEPGLGNTLSCGGTRAVTAEEGVTCVQGSVWGTQGEGTAGVSTRLSVNVG